MMPNDQWELNRRQHSSQHPAVPGHSRSSPAPAPPSQLEEVSSTVRYMRQQQQQQDPLGRGPYNAPIPRIRSRINNKDTQRSQVSNGRRFDTFGENALETIYDEFRFLDEPEAPSPTSSGHPIIMSPRPNTPPQPSILTIHEQKAERHVSFRFLAFCLLALIQLACAIALIILAVLRCRQFYQEQSWTSDDAQLLDLQAGDALQTEGIDLLRFKSGLSLFLPSIFQLLAAFCAFWPLVRRRQSHLQILHIVFSLISIFFWFSSVEAICYELNLNYVQLESLSPSKDTSYILYLVLLGLGYFEAIILPSLTLIFSCRLLVLDRRHSKSFINTVFAVGTALVSVTAVFFAGYSTSRTLHMPNSLSKPSVFYGMGLREVIVTTHVVFCSLLYFFATLHRDVGLSIASALLQLTNIVSLGAYIFNSSRLLAVIYDVMLLASPTPPSVVSTVGGIKTTSGLPLAFPSILLLYSFLLVLFILLTAQLITTVLSIRGKLVEDDRLFHSSPLTTTTTTSNSLAQERTTF